MKIKNFETFVNEQFDDFYDDFDESQRRLRLLTKFTKSKLDVKVNDMEVEIPQKRKFHPKIKVHKKKSDKGIF